MEQALFERIVAQLIPMVGDTAVRQTLVVAAFYGRPLLEDIQWDGAARQFAVRLVRQLDEYGEIETGKKALVPLLEALKKQVGVDRQKEIDELISLLAEPSRPPEVSLVAETTQTDMYVFISYARPDQPLAEQIEAYLKEAGIRVFRDKKDIEAGDNWDLIIETALRECSCMVLLLSKSSMPDRKEVHREWFYFDQKRKPIYPLYVEMCDLHTRFYAYNWIDISKDLQAGLGQLLNKLKGEFVLPETATAMERLAVFEGISVEPRTLPEALKALLAVVRQPEEHLFLSVEQARMIEQHQPANLTEYRLGRIAEWSLPQYQLNKRFVNLTLGIDQGETATQRLQWEPRRFNDLRDVMAARPERVFVLLGAPGSGKSTLLRRLQLDHSMSCLREENNEQISFFVPLNSYGRGPDGTLLPPETWLAERWQRRYPKLPPLSQALQQGRLLLLLDGLNEMPHKNRAEFQEMLVLWRTFAQDAAYARNQILFSCRSLDYSIGLSTTDRPVPQIDTQPMSEEQLREFLRLYILMQHEIVWQQLAGSPQLDLFKTPYFLKLLCDQVKETTDQSELLQLQGRASLFTGFVRQVLSREINRWIGQQERLLDEKDHQKIVQRKWRSPFDLPERGELFKKLNQLAFAMQQDSAGQQSMQVRLNYDSACALIGDELGKLVLKAGVALNLLDEDVTNEEILFFHQLLQEYFAARQFAKQPDPTLVQVEWQAAHVQPTLAELLPTLADSDPLPLLPQTGWEETIIMATAMMQDAKEFLQKLMAYNLPLAARCAMAAEIEMAPELKQALQQALIGRSQDYERADVRARMAAGLALGELGDPRFVRHTGPEGAYLLPPLVTIGVGRYPIGDDNSFYSNEKPAHTVEVAAFEIGQFPVTNAEYKLFIEAGGYEDERWWQSELAKAWRQGQGSNAGQKADVHRLWTNLQSWSEADIRGLVSQNRITSKQAESWTDLKNWSEDKLAQQLDEWYPDGQIYRQPGYWDDVRFNNPNQPVVGICWFEAWAYCHWLSAQTGWRFQLPSEIQFEAAARGKQGLLFPYGNSFDAKRSNTFESHIRQTTAVGIFDNSTAEGAFDLTGNVYTWTTTLYDQEKFAYPYRAEDGRESLLGDGRRVVRGGSWGSIHRSARAVYRDFNLPDNRHSDVGFRVVCFRPPS